MRYPIAVLLLACTAGCAGPSQTWTTHKDPSGFTIRHPPGWVVETGAKGLIKVRSADRHSFAILQPFVASRGTRAIEWIGRLPAPLNTLLPQARLESSRQAASKPDQALASFTCTRNGEPVRALALVSIYKSSGMLFAIAAPAAAMPAQQSDLVSILASFSFRAASKGGAAGGGLNWKRFADPTQGAFTVEVPTGWKVSGGIVQKEIADARQILRVSSPDDGVLIMNGDADVPSFTLPNQLLREGTWYGKTRVARYVGGIEFAMDYVSRTFGPQCSNLKFVSRSALTDQERQMMAQYPGLRVSMGEVAFTCEIGGRPARGLWFGGTSLIARTGVGGMTMGTWTVGMLSGYLASEEKHPLADAVFAHMCETYRQDPRWLAQQNHMALRVAEQQAKQFEEQMATREKNYWSRTRMWDEVTRKRANQIANRTDMVDTQTGERYQVFDGYNHYWVDSVGQRDGFASDIDAAPNVDVHPLMEWNAPQGR